MTKPTGSTNKIAYFRNKRGLSQTQLAEKMNEEHGTTVRQATISSWEKGTRPSAYNMEALTKSLGVEEEDLYEKSVLNDQGALYKTAMEAYDQALDKADEKFKEDQGAAYQMLRAKFVELKEQAFQISSNNSRFIEIFSKIGELLPRL